MTLSPPTPVRKRGEQELKTCKLKQIKLNAWQISAIAIVACLLIFAIAIGINVSLQKKLQFNIAINFLSWKNPQLTVSGRYRTLIPFEISDFTLSVENLAGKELFRLSNKTPVKVRVFSKPKVDVSVSINATALLTLIKISEDQTLVIHGSIPFKVLGKQLNIKMEKEYEMSQLFKNH